MDSPVIKALQQKYSAKLTEAEALSSKADATDADATKATELIAECKTIRGQIESAKAAQGDLAELKAWDNEPVGGLHQPGMAVKTGEGEPSGYADIEDKGAFKAMQQAGAGVLPPAQIKAISSSSYKAALNELFRARGDMSGVSASARKALEEGIDQNGGQLVGTEMAANILMRKPAPTELRNSVTQLTTSKDNLTFNTVQFSGDERYPTPVRIYKAGEKPVKANITADNPNFGGLRIPVNTFMMRLELYNDFIEDASIDIEGFIANAFREAVDLFDEDMLLNGTGVREPHGALVGVDTQNRITSVKSGHATKLTQDGLQALKFAIRRQYQGNLRWVFNSTSTGLALAQMKDTTDRPLWPMEQQAGMVNDVPANLLGYRYYYSDFTPDIAAGTFPILWGDPHGITLLRRVGFSIQFLREVGAEENKTVILGRYRMGADVTEPWKLRTQKIAA
ncbi:MAG TPA: phage major capsid protein [Abditibacteriaceae bacterium]